MSKTEIQQKIVALLKTLPKDRLNHYASFKDVQLARFSSSEIDNISEQDLKLQYMSLRDMVNDRYKNYYKLDDKMLRPKGNPQYYERILNEINGTNKETIFSALRTVLFGK